MVERLAAGRGGGVWRAASGADWLAGLCSQGRARRGLAVRPGGRGGPKTPRAQVSGQLSGEAYACALGDVYTFGFNGNGRLGLAEP